VHCIVHVQTRTLHEKRHPSIRESISLKWYPVMCPLSHPTLGILPSLCRYPISPTNWDPN
jgi:hypothetical protein